jgi:hypothetical protein
VAFERSGATAGARTLPGGAEVCGEGTIGPGGRDELGAADVHVGGEPVHFASYQPQQSVLNPQSAHRQTACIRYTLAPPQRSHTIFSSVAGGVREDSSGASDVTREGLAVSAMGGIIPAASVEVAGLHMSSMRYQLDDNLEHPRRHSTGHILSMCIEISRFTC